MTPTQEWLDEALGFWAKVLALESWHIKIRWVSSRELEDAYGDHCYDLTHRTGSIRIRDEPFKLNDNEEWEPEVVIIHELLHLPLALVCSVSKVDLEETLEERFINDIARALFQLRTVAVEAYKYGKEERSNDGDGGKDSPVRRGKKVGKKSGRRRKGSCTKGNNSS